MRLVGLAEPPRGARKTELERQPVACDETELERQPVACDETELERQPVACDETELERQPVACDDAQLEKKREGNKQPLSPDRGTTRPTKNETSRPPYTALLRAKKLV